MLLSQYHSFHPPRLLEGQSQCFLGLLMLLLPLQKGWRVLPGTQVFQRTNGEETLGMFLALCSYFPISNRSHIKVKKKNAGGGLIASSTGPFLCYVCQVTPGSLHPALPHWGRGPWLLQPVTGIPRVECGPRGPHSTCASRFSCSVDRSLGMLKTPSLSPACRWSRRRGKLS